MNLLFLTQTATPTQQNAEIIRDAVRVIDVFDQLGPLMAVLFVVSLALVVIVLIQFAARNSSASAINVLSQANTDKSKEILDLRAQLVEYQRLHVEGLSVIGAQSTRTNDLFEAMNNRSANRDLQQQALVATQGRIAESFDKLLNEGSAPLQQVAQDVTRLMNLVTSVDTRTNNWQAVIDGIPQIKQDIIKRLDELLGEVQKRSTKPLPAVDLSNGAEASPQ